MTTRLTTPFFTVELLPRLGVDHGTLFWQSPPRRFYWRVTVEWLVWRYVWFIETRRGFTGANL